ncbi:MAG TPA: PPC domain-containing DNA-binding protein [Burkholderiales bacterium]|nr:PPC domain-containing DNA-binding protein [Burkholderiales bacterium]
MHSKVLHEQDEQRTFALIFDTGDEVISTLETFARHNDIGAGQFSAIGAFSEVVLGYFDWDKKDYLRIEVKEQVEVLSLLGDLALDRGAPKAHAHVVLGKRDGTTCGGHLLQAHVRPTLELILNEPPAYLRREYDADSHLALIKIRS